MVEAILGRIREVKMEIIVLDRRRAEILTRAGQLFSGVFLGAPHARDSRKVLCTTRRIYVGFRVEISTCGQRPAGDSIAMFL